MMQILETSRLTFMPFSLALKKVALAEPAKLAELLGVRVPENWPGPDLKEALPFFIESMEHDATAAVWDGIIIHTADQVLIGDMGFMGGPNEAGAVEIGYSIITDYRNHGYATEMAQGLLRWAFAQPGVKRVTAECLSDNLGSIKVLEKIGMHRIGRGGDLLKWELLSISLT